MSEAVKIKANGQYETTNKTFFKGRTLVGNELVDVSLYIDKAIKDVDLKKMKINVSLGDIPQARKPKPVKAKKT
jgi:hypothetical protein